MRKLMDIAYYDFIDASWLERTLMLSIGSAFFFSVAYTILGVVGK